MASVLELLVPAALCVLCVVYEVFFDVEFNARVYFLMFGVLISKFGCANSLRNYRNYLKFLHFESVALQFNPINIEYKQRIAKSETKSSFST